MKRAYVLNEGGSFNFNFPIENKPYKVGEIITDGDCNYRVLFDDPIATRVEEIIYRYKDIVNVLELTKATFLSPTVDKEAFDMFNKLIRDLKSYELTK